MNWVFKLCNIFWRCSKAEVLIYVWDLLVLQWKVPLVLFVIFQTFCWSVNIKKSYFQLLLLLKLFLLVISLCMSRVSKFHIIFSDMLRSWCLYWRALVCHLWEVQFQLSSTFLAFFIWSANCSSEFFSHFLLVNENYMSWVFGLDFGDAQKLKH